MKKNKVTTKYNYSTEDLKIWRPLIVFNVEVPGIEPGITECKSVVIAIFTIPPFSTDEIFQCRSIGFLSFNKPVGLTLLKLVKLLGASVT